jgi:hypothetical protein
VGAVALASACNAIVGNGDVEFAGDGGRGSDSAAALEAEVETGPPVQDADAAASEAGLDAPDAVETIAAIVEAGDAAREASPDVGAGCEGGTKQCSGACASLDDPAYGCATNGCAPCELPNAVAGCASADGGPEGGALECSVAVCKGSHLDCNGLALDGCEIDSSDDLYNCGACGLDCSKLPHVAGNVRCAAGVCAFDDSACAPGYAICGANPEDGCDTVISDPAHCGTCTTACGSGAPYCSPSGGAATPFTCTSGCAAGLSLCGGSCVDETTDPDHCGGCGTQCPAVAGGTSTCSGASPSCGFVCNANDHLCGSGSTAFCAANNDANNCGVGAACGACPQTPNSTSVCSGGTTCSSTCDPSAHSCAGTCPLDTDPNNCGTFCGTNCPGPTNGSGSPGCDGQNCTIVCDAGATLCGTACVDELTDNANCGSCDKACSNTQACSGGKCSCGSQTCPNGCCDANQVCQPAACGTGGAACAAGCPATVPEASNLVLWLVGDTYATATSTWFDQSGRHADATCTQCPSAVSVLNGHNAVSFDGSSYFALTDPGAAYASQSFTLFVVAAPGAGAPSNAQLIAFSNANNQVGLERSGTSGDLVFQVLPGSSTNSIVATGGWGGAWEQVIAGVDPSQNGFLAVGGSTTLGSIGSPAAVNYLSSYLGTDPTSQTQTYQGQIAEVIVFDTTGLSSLSSIHGYLSNRYGLP